MHEGQVQISVEQVAALLADELPELGGRRITAVQGAGTVHAIFRIGPDIAARFPLRAADAAKTLQQLRHEAAAAEEFRNASPIAAPEPLHIGHPGHGYPMPWSVQSWLPGTTATPTSCEQSTPFVADLGELIVSLRQCNTGGRSFRGSGRGGVLTDHDEWVEMCIRRNADDFDSAVLEAMWVEFRSLDHEDSDAMCHTDLIPWNLLVDEDKHIVGVLDTGGFQPADPALDLVSAWHLLSDQPRQQLRATLGCSDLQWERGKAWAFQQAAGLPWYYRDTNPAMAQLGTATLQRLLDDRG